MPHAFTEHGAVMLASVLNSEVAIKASIFVVRAFVQIREYLSTHKELAEKIGITEQNLSLLKSGKVRGVRFETLSAICKELQCQPGDLLEWREGED